MGKFLKAHLGIVIVLVISLLIAILLPFIKGKTVTIPVSVPTQDQR